ncbi:5-formyltetrahydrofolate cyclo-ligase [Tepidimicrobium xylanilyticum]|uniref:5-formyltetrahydrofolate cyclo-ligase n=1 Tax=Tepidimicrobium xylanilyticum TaxID=1123352 RepID=A0A1H2V168_9FIRM|nr:5-formyltetrahydrofolate cyclo-ligase [Tepidimicrobium xylanilyticum]GMG96760.1 5-formyltetrahydrofolate cyclo-ligase [Tepidimicrobium xylanilyticum]SDW62055.1 5-formyltetrahydrofolate cyclo-ligase [Tepidimicrobium xylanilyticum]
MDKKAMRKEILEKRSKLTEEEIREKSNIIKEKLMGLDKFKKSKFIFSFISFGDEVDTHNIIKEALNLGKRIGVPITVPEKRRLLVSELYDFDKELELGYYNILTPKKEYIREVDPKEIDMVLVPGVVFTPDGYRIGYGGGYYDRFFNKNDKLFKIGLCFDLQIAEKIPVDIYDIPVNCIITEKKIINCSKENF